MNLILTTKEEADRQFLIHSRTKGSKNGQRLYQYENGQLTPLGKIHYGQMYGWGAGNKDKARIDDKKAQKEQKRQEKAARKEARRQEREEKERKRDEEAEARAEERRRIYEADEKKKVDEIMSRVAEKQSAAAERDAQAERERKSREEEQRSVRTMSDDELNKALNRLRLEKQYSELLNERANREKGPVAVMASKLFQEAAQDLGKKALTVVVDKLVDKAKEQVSNKFKLADFKDVDPYSLPSDKLKAVSEAFNMAANLARNRNVVNNGGRDPNQGGGDNNQQKQNNNQQKQNNNNQRFKQSSAKAPEGNKNGGTQKSETPKEPVDRSEQNWSYMTAASANRQQLRNNLDTTKRNVRRAEKFFDTFSKEAKLEADAKAKEERLKQFSDWVNGAEWAKEKVKIQAKQAQDEEIRRQAKAKAQAIADEVHRDFERRDAQAKAEKKEAERQAKARKSARMFGYSW